MTRNEFNREIDSIEKYYFSQIPPLEKEEWYKLLHNIPLDTMKRAKLRLFAISKCICTRKDFFALCWASFEVSPTKLFEYMKDKGYFYNEDVEKRVKYYAKAKVIPAWLKVDMRKYKKQYFLDLIRKED